MSTVGHPPLAEEALEHFNVVMCPRAQPPSDAIEQVLPQAVCLEFDYPDRGGLAQAVELRSLYPRLPMFVITVQHSEELAVWTFRSGFCDFLVAPVSAAEFQRVSVLINQLGETGSRVMTAGDRRQVLPAPTPTPAPAPAEAGRPPTRGRKALLPALYFVQQHYREKIESAEVATLCNMSPFRFSREFHEVFGITFRDYVVRYRLKEAKRLLRNPNASITDVAFAVGFNDLSYFSRMFRRYFGAAPSALLSESARAAVTRPHAPADTGATATMLGLPMG